jgi:hypothetical protein
MVNLGDLVEDKISGFKGIAVARHSYLNGCDRITVQPEVDKHGKMLDSASFDEPQLKIISTRRTKKLQGSKLTGGTDKYLDEGK